MLVGAFLFGVNRVVDFGAAGFAQFSKEDQRDGESQHARDDYGNDWRESNEYKRGQNYRKNPESGKGVDEQGILHAFKSRHGNRLESCVL